MRVTPAVRAIFMLEIRSLLRDPRTVLMSVVLPVLLIPVALLVGNWMDERRAEREDERIYNFAVTGTDSAFALDLLARAGSGPGAGADRGAGASAGAGAGASASAGEGADEAAPGAPAEARPEGGRVRFRRIETADALEALQNGDVDLYLEALTPAEWDAVRPDSLEVNSGAHSVEQEAGAQGESAEEAESGAESVADADTRVAGDSDIATDPDLDADVDMDGGALDADVRVLRIRFVATRTASRQGASELREHLMEARQARRDSIVMDAGFPVSPGDVASVDVLNVASEGNVQGARLGRYLTMILVGLILLGGSAVATDTLAGEKERGTLETLLTSAASRNEIVWGKLLSIMAVGLSIALIQFANLWIFVGLGLLGADGALATAVTPGIARALLVLYLPLVALVSGLLLLMSAHARSYKEAQLYLTPVLLGMLLPTLVPFLPDLSLRSAMIMVPIANLSLAARDLLIGEINLPLFAVAWLVTASAATWVGARSVRALHDESLVTGNTTREEFLGGPELFQKKVLHWFLVFWGLKIIIDFNLTFEDIRMAALVSVGLVFLAFPWLVIRHFRLDPVQALALRLPRPGVWIGVLLGVPAALLVMTSAFRLVDFVLPMPNELIENFGQSLLPESIPAWQILLLLSVLPGIAEELTFRGVLLHGLRRRFGPVTLALVVGIIFGIFHFQLFRIPMTAGLGAMLAGVTLMTGSIFPAIAWHALNNALAIFLSSRGVDLAFEGWWVGPAALLVLGVAFLIIWMNRTPYPDVGPRVMDRDP